jgi:hypothetical protein
MMLRGIRRLPDRVAVPSSPGYYRYPLVRKGKGVPSSFLAVERDGLVIRTVHHPEQGEQRDRGDRPAPAGSREVTVRVGDGETSAGHRGGEKRGSRNRFPPHTTCRVTGFRGQHMLGTTYPRPTWG